VVRARVRAPGVAEPRVVELPDVQRQIQYV
jgi:hypothetical protein